MSRAALRPLPGSQRLGLLDCVRGFALLGICLANLVSFAGLYVMTPAQVAALPWPAANALALLLIDGLIEGKFYTLFSLLFGAGFALQSQRAERAGLAFARFWRRRMAVLCLFGLLHMSLIWYGDILTLYSLMGLCLLAWRRVSSRGLLLWSGALLLVPLLIHSLLILTPEQGFWQVLARYKTELQAQWGLAERTLFEMRRASAASEVLASNLLNAVLRPMAYLQSGRPFQVLGLFLLGMWLAREMLPRLTAAQPPRLRRYVALLGLLGSALYAGIKAATGQSVSAGALGLLQSLAYHVGCLCLALVYLRLLVRAWQAPRWRGACRALSVLGRMPLTHYIGQSCIGIGLFYGYGLAWLGRVPFVALIALAALIVGLQYLFGRYWLAHHEQGPLERLWRWLSYPRAAGVCTLRTD